MVAGFTVRGGIQGPDEPLRDFITRKGGINECAARFARRLGRGGKVAQQVSSDEVAALHTERQ